MSSEFVSRFLNLSQFDWGKMKFQSSFNLPFLIAKKIEYLKKNFQSILFFPLRLSVDVHSPWFSLGYFSDSAKIHSHSVAFLYNPISFAVQKLFDLLSSHLSSAALNPE